MQVELLTNGGYDGTGCCVGKVFSAQPFREGYLIKTKQLALAGYDDLHTMESLYFLTNEVRILHAD